MLLHNDCFSSYKKRFSSVVILFIKIVVSRLISFNLLLCGLLPLCPRTSPLSRVVVSVITYTNLLIVNTLGTVLQV